MVKLSQKTMCVHSGTIIDKEIRGINTPIHPSTSHGYLDSEERIYPRYFNTVNQRALVDKISALENAETGLVFSSGMAAITTTLLSFLKKDDHAVFQKGLYGGTFHFVATKLKNFGIDYTITESNSVSDFEKALKNNTKVVYIETPSNPLLAIVDLSQIAELAKSKGVITICDNTFATPINQTPLNLGIDIVIHSATKYLGGHHDICAGLVVSSQKNIQPTKEMALSLGGSLNAISCYLLERSMKTLSVRVKEQNFNALKIAESLEENPKVKKVYYPGLRSNEGHDIAKKQMTGFGGMLSFELKSQDPVSFQRNLNLIRPSLSLGGVDTIICSPAITSHRHLSKEQRQREEIKDSLLRLSVGIEDVYDLINDLEGALK